MQIAKEIKNATLQQVPKCCQLLSVSDSKNCFCSNSLISNGQAKKPALNEINKIIAKAIAKIVNKGEESGICKLTKKSINAGISNQAAASPGTTMKITRMRIPITVQNIENTS